MCQEGMKHIHISIDVNRSNNECTCLGIQVDKNLDAMDSGVLH